MLLQIPLHHFCAASALDLPTVMHLSRVLQQFMDPFELPATYATLMTFAATTWQPLVRYVKECWSLGYLSFVAYQADHLDDLVLTIFVPELAVVRWEQAFHNRLDCCVSLKQENQVKIIRRKTPAKLWRMYVRPESI